MRREEPDRVIAPVVGQPPRGQRTVGHRPLDRQQLDRGHPQADQVLEHRRVPKPGVGAAKLRRQLRVGRGDPLDVGLVDHRVGQAGAWRPVVAPVEGRVDHDRPRRERGRVLLVVAGEAVVPGDPADDRLGVGVQQQLGRVAAQPPRGVVGAVHPVAVPLPGPDLGHEPVPHPRVVLRQRQLRLPVLLVEQAQDDCVGDLGRHGKPRAARRWRRPQRERRPRPHLNHRFHQPLQRTLLPAPLVALQGGPHKQPWTLLPPSVPLGPSQQGRRHGCHDHQDDRQEGEVGAVIHDDVHPKHR